MEFFFVDPGPLIDHELELVAPGPRHVEDLLASCRHPLCANDRAASTTTRERVHEFLKRAPGGHERADPDRGTVPAYHFWMRLHAQGGLAPQPPPVRIAGGIGLRIGQSRDLEMYLGHVGYNVYPPARGNHYAERACRLILPIARHHGMRALWITCNPDNYASRRTCERLGCALVDTVAVPPGHTLHQRGELEKCRYRLDL